MKSYLNYYTKINHVLIIQSNKFSINIDVNYFFVIKLMIKTTKPNYTIKTIVMKLSFQKGI